MKQKNPLWGSISTLIAAVIAILAFVRGKWEIPLLVSVFILWGAWAFFTLLLPNLRAKRAQRKANSRIERDAWETERNTLTAVPDSELAPILLRHVNHRISAQFKPLYPNIRWEWKVSDPAYLVAHGGIGRIRLYGVPDYDYADVELDRNGHLSCSLVKLLDAENREPVKPPEPPNHQQMDPQVWYETRGRETLETLIADLDSRGHNSLMLKEDGSICIRPTDGSEETVQDTLHSFPERTVWPKLVKVLEQVGLAATAGEEGVIVAW